MTHVSCQKQNNVKQTTHTTQYAKRTLNVQLIIKPFACYSSSERE